MLDNQSIKILKYIRKNPSATDTDISQRLKIKDINAFLQFLCDEKYLQGKTYIPTLNTSTYPYAVTAKGIIALNERKVIFFKDILLPIISTVIKVIGIPLIAKWLIGL